MFADVFACLVADFNALNFQCCIYINVMQSLFISVSYDKATSHNIQILHLVLFEVFLLQF
jgi:hypothetical protein